MEQSQKNVLSLFEEISNNVLSGSVDLAAIRSECEKLSELTKQVSENRDSAKIKHIEAAIEDLLKLKQNLSQGTTSKPLDDAVDKYRAELNSIKKALVMEKPKVQKESAWKQQIGKKKIEEGTVVLQTYYYGLGNPIEIECFPVDDDQTAPSGFICKRKDNSLFVVINNQILEIPQCYFNVAGDPESDGYHKEGTRFYNPDRDDGKQDMSKYADIYAPQGNSRHVPHQVNKDGTNRAVRKPKTVSSTAAMVERFGLVSSAMVDLFSALNIRTKKGPKTN